MSVGLKQVPDQNWGRLKWDARLISGGTPSTSENSFWTDNESNGTPFVAIADMSGRELVTATNKGLTHAGMQSRNMPIGEPGTLLLAMYASVGEVALLGIRATWNQALLGIIPDPKRLDTRYLRYVLLAMRTDLLRDVRSTTQDNLNAGQIGDLWFPKPGLDEQRAIADYLDQELAQIDALVAKQEEFIGLLRERRTHAREVLASHVSTGPRLRWTLHEVDVRAGTRASELPLFSVSIDWGVRRRDETTDKLSRAEELDHYKVCLKGDIVINRMRAFQGALGVAPADGVVSPDYAVLRAKHNVDSEWLAELMRTKAFVSEIIQRLRGIGGTSSGNVRTPRINTADLLDIRAHIPTAIVQQAELATLTEEGKRIDALIAKAEEHIALAKERRSALITAAVTGQFDVRTAKKGARV